MSEPPSVNQPGIFEEEGYPEACPICARVNFRTADDYCDHFWATVYDGELINGPFAEKFERLWSNLESAYHTSDDLRARRFINNLRQNDLAEIADAIVRSEKLWWLDRVEHKNYIDAEASLASGSGWNLYREKAGWFEELISRMEKAIGVANV